MLGTAPIKQQSIIGLLLRALYIDIMNIAQLLLTGAVSKLQRLTTRLSGMQWGGCCSNPEGPCIQRVDTLAPKYPNWGYFKAQAAIWVRGPL